MSAGFESPRRNLVVVGGNESAVHLLVVRSRVDPTDGFKAYTGGYNVTNTHYWAVSRPCMLLLLSMISPSPFCNQRVEDSEALQI